MELVVLCNILGQHTNLDGEVNLRFRERES